MTGLHVGRHDAFCGELLSAESLSAFLGFLISELECRPRFSLAGPSISHRTYQRRPLLLLLLLQLPPLQVPARSSYFPVLSRRSLAIVRGFHSNFSEEHVQSISQIRPAPISRLLSRTVVNQVLETPLPVVLEH